MALTDTFDNPQSRVEAILQNAMGAEHSVVPQSRVEELLERLDDYLENIEGRITDQDEEIIAAVNSWLEDNPEATTTVQDGSLTEAKFSDTLKLATIKDYVTPEMFGAVGDGVTDDSISFKTAVNTGKMVYCSKSYLITQKIKLIKGVDGFGTVIFSGSGCFTISVGTSLRNITLKTTNKCIDIVDTDITSSTAQNINARLLFENLTIICVSGADTIFSLVSTTYGFFNAVFKNINFTGECNLAVKLESDENVSTSWLNQVYFIDCLFASPLKVIEANRVDNIIFERCTTQKSSNNASNLLYDFVNCNRASFINCHDWDYISAVKLYRFVNCKECELFGTDRTIDNFDMTLKEWYDTFRIAQSKYSYSPQIFNVSHLVRNAGGMDSEVFFDGPSVGYIMMPVHGVVDGESITAIRATNSQAGYHGLNSFDLAVTPQGKIKLRVRVYDMTSQDSDGHYHTKWSNWYTFTPDQ